MDERGRTRVTTRVEPFTLDLPADATAPRLARAAITEARTKLSVVDENGNDTTHRATAAAQEALDAFAGAVDAKLVAGPPPATLGANVEEQNRTIAQTLAECVAIDRVELLPSGNQLARNALDLCKLSFSKRSDIPADDTDIITGDHILYKETPFVRFNQLGCSQHLKVLGGVRNRQVCLGGKFFDGPGSLA